MKVKELELARIWCAGILDPEGSLDEPYPPIIVGPRDVDGEHELIDGYHRLAAAKNDGRRRIRAIIVSPEEYTRLETMREEDWIEWIQSTAEEL